MLGATVTVTSVSKINGTEQASAFVNRLMESSGSVLTRTAPELLLSKQKYRQAEGITLVRNKRDEQKQSLAFSSRPFVLCGLPVTIW